MKIAFTADLHVQHLEHPESAIERLIQDVRAKGADVFCVGGDMGEGARFGADPLYDLLLGGHLNSLFVLGNHDLFIGEFTTLTPPEAMEHNKRHFKEGFLLEKSWEDTNTVKVIDDCAFVGCMGFPDFAHPRLAGKREFYDTRSATIDHRFMDLADGWVVHTERMHQAFSKRLEASFATKSKTIVVLTHYPILEGQSTLQDEGVIELQVWPYFFNWTMGRMVLGLAKEHPDKRVWCLAGHSHEFCRGKLTQEAANVHSLGLKTTYHTQDFFVLDTEIS